jgi:hypothetical protein
MDDDKTLCPTPGDQHRLGHRTPVSNTFVDNWSDRGFKRYIEKGMIICANYVVQ